MVQSSGAVYSFVRKTGEITNNYTTSKSVILKYTTPESLI